MAARSEGTLAMDQANAFLDSLLKELPPPAKGENSRLNITQVTSTWRRTLITDPATRLPRRASQHELRDSVWDTGHGITRETAST